MKSIKLTKKLNLRKSTVSDLTATEMNVAVGGEYYSYYAPCTSYGIPCDSRETCTLCNCVTLRPENCEH